VPDARYRAVLIGNWYFPEDPANLPELRGPINDVTRLAEALTGATGMFPREQTTVLSERSSQELLEALERFFSEARRDDVLLVYYSGHGLTNDRGDALLMCARNSRTDRKVATMVSSDHVNAMIAECAAGSIVLILDCCHSGAFRAGEIGRPLAGRGRFVITSCRSKQLAPDADSITGMSRFTGHLVAGLSGGASIESTDEHITVTDVYRYVHAAMVTAGQAIPQLIVGGDGDVALVRNIRPRPASEPIPATGTGTLTVSTNLIDIGEVDDGETLATEYVSVRAASGVAGEWTVETKSNWLRVTGHGTYFDVDLHPLPGRNTATILVHDDKTGEVQVVRVTVTVRAATRPEPVLAPAMKEAEPAPPTPESAGPVETVGPASAQVTNVLTDLRPQGPVLARLAAMLADLRENWHSTSTRIYLGQGVPPKKDHEARSSQKVPPNEKTFALIDITLFGGAKDGWIFTDTAVYFKEISYRSTRIPYARLHEFPAVYTKRITGHCVDLAGSHATVGGEEETRRLVAILNEIGALAQ
jgi:hypothetical protein